MADTATLELLEAEEHALIDVQLLLIGLMRKKKISAGELAHRAGVSERKLIAVLQAEGPVTISLLARLTAGLNEDLQIRTKRRRRGSALTRFP